MSSDISDLILSLTPEDGSSIGNGAMLALLREHVPTVTDEAYEEARDALVDAGTLARGKVSSIDLEKLPDGFRLQRIRRTFGRATCSDRGRIYRL